MTLLRRSSLAFFVAPLTLALAACGGGDEAANLPQGEAIAPVAAPAGQSWIEVAAETPEGGVRIGNPDAPLKLVEYASHTCSHCAAFSQQGAAPLDEHVNTGRVSYELRNQIHDGLDLTIAVLARCGGPATFHPLANQAWGNFEQVMAGAQANGEQLEAAMATEDDTRLQKIAQASGVLEFFAARGVSRDQALQCLADTDKAEAIAEASQTQSQELGVEGTPTFFLNGTKVPGTTWAELEPALQRAGAR